MNITPWTMYWITRLNDIQGFFQGTGIVCVLFGIFAAVIVTAIVCDGDSKASKKLLWLWAIPVIGFICFIISTLIPTEKDMAAILIIPKIVNNQQIQKIPSKIMDLATEWLDALKPKK